MYYTLKFALISNSFHEVLDAHLKFVIDEHKNKYQSLNKLKFKDVTSGGKVIRKYLKGININESVFMFENLKTELKEEVLYVFSFPTAKIIEKIENNSSINTVFFINSNGKLKIYEKNEIVKKLKYQL